MATKKSEQATEQVGKKRLTIRLKNKKVAIIHPKTLEVEYVFKDVFELAHCMLIPQARIVNALWHGTTANGWIVEFVKKKK